MSNAEVLDVMRTALVVAMKLAAPPLILSMAIGVIISILQAATQIHEQTITFVPKLIILALVFLFTGSWMLQVMQSFTFDLFALMKG